MPTSAVTPKMLEAAAALRPDDVVSYLIAHGWTDAGQYGPLARLYRRETDTGAYEAVIPTSNDVADYAWRIFDLIGLLAAINDCGPDAIYSDLVPDSVTTVRPDSGIGGIPSRRSPDEKAIAHAILSHLSSLKMTAEHNRLDDLARFIELAALAAKQATEFQGHPAEKGRPETRSYFRDLHDRKH